MLDQLSYNYFLRSPWYSAKIENHFKVYDRQLTRHRERKDRVSPG